MRIVHEAVENGVGVGGIANDLVPCRERELGSDDRRSAAMTLFEDFEQVMTGAPASRGSRPKSSRMRRTMSWQSFGQR
jgi:hypothetical protein